MHDTVTDRIGNNRRTDLITPAWYIELGTEDDRTLFVTRFCNFQQVTGFAFLELV